MLAKIKSAALLGVEALPVMVETDVANGLPSFTIVGLPDGSVRESKDRVKSAIKNSGYPYPNRKVTVNLAPASLRKEGAAFDLPIALGLLVTSELISPDAVRSVCAVGELSLDGTLRGVPGVLSIALAAGNQEGITTLIVPSVNGYEASMAGDLDIVAAESLYEVVEVLNNVRERRVVEPVDAAASQNVDYPFDIADIKGQEHSKRALEVAACGMHNILLEGPPGTGKTMLARTLPAIIGEWSFEERLETTKIYSIAGLNKQQGLISHRPFRAPHHTISDAGLIGGGTVPRPGEVSLAHNGVLFLDELPEFRRHVLEVLRQPLEDGMVTISRAQANISFPANFMLVSAMNPCPCGFLGSPRHQCCCQETQIVRYRNRISGPLLDRIDIRVEVNSLEIGELYDHPRSECSADVRRRVNRASSIQARRFDGTPFRNNGQMSVKAIEQFCQLDHTSQKLLEKSVDRLGLSTRSFHRILKISRTIADMDQCDAIASRHVAEAIGYRREHHSIS